MSNVLSEVSIDMLAWAKNSFGHQYGKDIWYNTSTAIIKADKIDDNYYIIISQVNKGGNDIYTIIQIDNQHNLYTLNWSVSRNNIDRGYKIIIKQAELFSATTKKAEELGLPYNWVAAMELV